MLDVIKDWITELLDALASIDMSFLGDNWDFSFFKLVLIVFFGGSMFEIVFSKNMDEETFFDDD